MDFTRGKSLNWQSTGRRGKRLQESGTQDHEQDGYYEDDEEEDESSQPDGKSDASGAATRSSVRCVASAVSKFDQQKRDLVRSIGFSGLLDLPQINKVNRSFTVWLLSRLDPETRTIVVNGEPVIDMVDLDVRDVLGIPCASRPVQPLPHDDAKSRKQFMLNCLGAEVDETNSLVAAGRIVKQDYNGGMTKSQMDNFKVAFVIFVVGHLLAPTNRNNVGNSSFWGALLKPDEIGEYNWSEFLLVNLMQAARNVQNDIKIKKRVTTVTGCAIFLQILYLDSLRLGSLTIPKDITPRIKGVSCQQLRLMIQADQHGEESNKWGVALEQSYGKAKSDEQFSDGVHAAGYNYTVSNLFKDAFGIPLTQIQKSALQVHEQRCDEHFKTLKRNLMTENVTLLEHLFDGVKQSTRGYGNPRSFRPSFMDQRDKKYYEGSPNTSSRQPQRKYAISTPQGYERAMKVFEARKRARNASYRSHHHVETILSGGSLSDSGLEFHSPVQRMLPLDGASAGNGGKSSTPKISTHEETFEAPSFDLGIEFQSQLKYMESCKKANECEAGTSQHNFRCDMDNLSNVPNQSPVLPNAASQVDAPTTTTNECHGTPAHAKKQDSLTAWSTPIDRLKAGTNSPVSLTKMLADDVIVGRIMQSEEEININMKPCELVPTNSPILKVRMEPGRLSKSPWFHGFQHRTCGQEAANKALKEVTEAACSDMTRPWIVHSMPRSIELSGKERMNQLEREMYEGSMHTPWRHIFESDFSVLAMAEESPVFQRSVRAQFHDASIVSKLNRCRMIVVPARVIGSWCSYFWDFKKTCVHVIDPTYKPSDPSDCQRVHDPAVHRIGVELSRCIKMFFDNWNVNFAEWKKEYVVPPIETGSGETGLFTLLSVREFDGEMFRNFTKEKFLDFKVQAVAEILCLQGNEIKCPILCQKGPSTVRVVHNIDD
ncbi:hypothetical protein ACP70R_040717 [Stipagrostis hirtigluma subsp. patula]